MTEPNERPAASPSPSPSALSVVGYGTWRTTAKGDRIRDLDVAGLTVRCAEWVSADGTKRRVFAPTRKADNGREFPVCVDAARLDTL